MRNSSYRILSYKIKHSYDVKEFLDDYRNLLQRAVDAIWENIEWRRKGKRLVPLIPKSREFKKNLRNSLLRDWSYATHYADSAVRVAYSIIESWRRNYIKGRRGRKKPVVKKKFVRVKETLYVYRNKKIRVTVKPRELYLEFDLTRAWFKRRVEGCDLGELILKEDELIIIFRKPADPKPANKIAWDLNLLSMDGFCDKGWIRIDLKPLYTMHIAYENKRRKLQRLSKEKPKTARRLLEKYSKRHKNRVKDFLHKLTTELAREFRGYEHGFENLEKQGMFNNKRVHNRVISRQNWRQIVTLMSYKARVKLLDPRNSTKTCPRCGGRMKRLEGQVLECDRCRLRINRQLNGAINLYLRMWGFPPSPSTFHRVVTKRVIHSWKMHVKRGSGITLKGCEAHDVPPMNPEGDEANVCQGLS